MSAKWKEHREQYSIDELYLTVHQRVKREDYSGSTVKVRHKGQQPYTKKKYYTEDQDPHPMINVVINPISAKSLGNEWFYTDRVDHYLTQQKIFGRKDSYYTVVCFSGLLGKIKMKLKINLKMGSSPP